MVTTVKEIQDRKAKLRETKAGRGELAEQEAVDKLARDRGEGADPITQELLDELRGKGIDVFDPKVLRKLNDLAKRGEITREEIQRLTARDEEINQTLQEEQAAETKEEIDRSITGKFETVAEGVGIGGGVVQIATKDIIARRLVGGSIGGILDLEGNPLDLVRPKDRELFLQKIGEDLTVAAIASANKMPLGLGGTFQGILTTGEQTIEDQRDLANMAVGDFREGNISPEDALLELDRIEGSVNSAYAKAHRAGRFSNKGFFEGLDELETKNERTLAQLKSNKQTIIREAASRISGLNLETTARQRADEIAGEVGV